MTRLRNITVTVALVLIALATATALGAMPQRETGPAYRCFPAKLWNADPSYRPCVVIRRVYEDGSFRAAVYDADGEHARFTVGVGARDR